MLWKVIIWIFDSESFVPRDQCGDWGTILPIIYQLSDYVIAFSYFCIPFLLIKLWKERKELLPKSWILLIFAAFIFLCGLGHFIDGLSFHYPFYRFNTIERVLTAIISFIATILTVPITKHFCLMKTEQEYKELYLKYLRLNERHEIALDLLEVRNRILDQRNEKLNKEADELRKIIEKLNNKYLMKQEYKEMREILHKIRDS